MLLVSPGGGRGIELTGFLGGLVNTTVTVGELATRTHTATGRLLEAAYRAARWERR
jgi:uncharacterized membrane protein (DUF4010 family)